MIALCISVASSLCSSRELCKAVLGLVARGLSGVPRVLSLEASVHTPCTSTQLTATYSAVRKTRGKTGSVSARAGPESLALVVP